MSVSLCPIAEVHAPIQRVWVFLSEPSNYARWWDAQTKAILPPGPAQAGQQILATTGALGREWGVQLFIRAVDEAKHQIHIETRLPLGITVFNHITCTRESQSVTQVSFG